MQPVYFTTKVAKHSAFCNREQESKMLLAHIEKNQHIVVVAPRRYGKTSLVAHVLNKIKEPSACIDLFCVVYKEDICKKVAKGISQVIHQIMSFSEKAIEVISQCFKSAYIGFQAGKIELKVEIGKPTFNVTSQLEDLLTGLETLAAKHKQPVTLFFDEFQDVLKIDETNKIQAVIRAVAQHSKYVTYIFSGSSRKMLHKIFDDKNQPLYMLCQKIILQRIEQVHLTKHMQTAARQRWKTLLAEESTRLILTLTEAHSYYFNLLCSKLWESDKPPTTKDISRHWEEVMLENKGKIIADLAPLNSNRIKVLTIIALLGEVNEPNSKVFLDKVKLPLSSTQNAVKYLLDNDFIYETETGLKLVDPLLRKFIVERFG